MTDPIADMLTRIRNGYRAKKTIVILPLSRLKKELADVLKKERYIQSVSVNGNELELTLSYEEGTPKVTHISRISKPGLRRYAGVKDIPRILGGLGTVILSTPKGLMTGRMAKKENVGGEMLCKMY